MYIAMYLAYILVSLNQIIFTIGAGILYKTHIHILLFSLLAMFSGLLNAEPLLGDKTPGFQGRDLQGKLQQLSDHAGKIVVLEWSSPECPYSRRYYDNGTLNSLYDYAAINGIAWINIIPALQTMTLRQAGKHLNTAKKLVILDPELDISATYAVSTTPQVLILDRQGRLVYSGAIDSSAMLKKTAGATVPYVRHALEDLQAGREVKRKITRAFGCYINSKRQKPGQATGGWTKIKGNGLP